ncbi:hypothetical protein [Acidisphaera sp. L21]|uniref:hypothetical protein n=1 Tax=Acidisphaera sp. L21 TaxID=1641851 RepID=UPI00131C1FD9|nr:hypothetical protein [Acidisphaera sp. L21]
MAQPRMNVALGDGSAVLSLLPGSGAEGSVTLTPGQLLELIGALGAARARLVGDLPPDAKERGLEATGVQAVVAPAWIVRPEALTEGSMLAFAHPAFGTVGFVLAAAEVRKMVSALTSHLGMVHSGEVGEARN